MLDQPHFDSSSRVFFSFSCSHFFFLPHHPLLLSSTPQRAFTFVYRDNTGDAPTKLQFFTVLLSVVFLDKHASGPGIAALMLCIAASTQVIGCFLICVSSLPCFLLTYIFGAGAGNGASVTRTVNYVCCSIKFPNTYIHRALTFECNNRTLLLFFQYEPAPLRKKSESSLHKAIGSSLKKLPSGGDGDDEEGDAYGKTNCQA